MQIHMYCTSTGVCLLLSIVEMISQAYLPTLPRMMTTCLLWIHEFLYTLYELYDKRQVDYERNSYKLFYSYSLNVLHINKSLGTKFLYFWVQTYDRNDNLYSNKS
jgi:hypothetical protein